MGSALQLDGVDDHVDVSAAANAASINGAFTISLWLRAQSTGSEQTLLSINGPDGNAAFRVYLDGDGRLSTARDGGNSVFNSGKVVADGQWRHVVVTREEPAATWLGEAQVYVDGKLIKPYNAGGWGVPQDATWLVGAHLKSGQPTGRFEGSLDEVRVYDRAFDSIDQSNVFTDVVKRGEYMYLMGRVPLSAVTHQTIASGDWSDPAIWRDGNLPADGANVLIAGEHAVTFDLSTSPRLRTVRVDGDLRFSAQSDTSMTVDLLAVTTDGRLEIGVEGASVPEAVTTRIVFAPVDAAKPEIDLKWDPMRISRGLVSRGELSIFGAEKTPYATLAGSHQAGEDRLRLKAVPTDWRVGDSLVITGTARDASGNHADNSVFQDEVVTITEIDRQANSIAFRHQDVADRTSLRFTHSAPDRVDASGNPLKVYVANMTRNVRLETEGWSPKTPVPVQGHTMFVHTRNISVNDAGFYGLGRSDKSQPVNDPMMGPNGLVPGTGENRRGRYPIHLHKHGADDFTNTEVVDLRGNAIWGSPGWGVVIHDSRAVVEDNVSFDVAGAHFVTEDGNEIAEFRRNLAIKSVGGAQGSEAPHEREANHDRGFAGHGYWLESSFSARAFEDNIAVSQTSAGVFVWGRLDNTNNLLDVPVENLVAADAGIAGEETTIKAWKVPLREFERTTVYNSLGSLEIAGHVRDDTGADYHSTGHASQGSVDQLTGWALHGYGVGVNYASKVRLTDITVLGDLEDPVPVGNRNEFKVVDGFGVFQMKNTRFVELVNPHVEGFHYGVTLGQTGGQGLMAEDEVPVGMTVIDGGYFANNTVHLASADGRVANDPSDTPVREAPPYGLWSQIKNDPYFESLGGEIKPVADFNAVSLGGRAAAFDGGGSFDPTYTLEWSERNDNTIASFAWDFDGDGATDAWGREVDHLFESDGEHDVTLTVTDRFGVSESVSKTVAVESGPYADLIPAGDSTLSQPTVVDSDQDGRSVGHYGPGWWVSEWSWDIRDGVVKKVRDGSRPYAHYIVPQTDVYRGELSLDFDYWNGDADGKANEFSVTVYGINGDGFRLGDWQTPYSLYNDQPVEIATLYSSGNLGAVEASAAAHSAAIDVGTGFDYLIVTLVGSGQIKPSAGDSVAIDNLQISGRAATDRVSAVSVQPLTNDLLIEGEAASGFELTRSGPSSEPLTVTYSVSGTADGSDYLPFLSGEVTFAAGERTVLLPVTPVSDGANESSETLRVSVVDGVGYEVDAASVAELTIADPFRTTPSLRVHLPLEESLTDVAGGYQAIVGDDPELLLGGGLDLDGKKDQIELPAEALAQLGPTGQGEEATVELWIRPDEFGGYKTVFDTPGRQISLWLHKPTEGWYAVGGVSNRVVFDQPFTLDEWQHVAMVLRDGQTTLYRNGVAIANLESGPIKAAPIVIGGNPSGGGSHFDGQVRDFRVYNHALSPEELSNSIELFSTVTVVPLTDQLLTEGTSADGFVLTRNGPSSGPLTVSYTVSGTADTTDYQEVLTGEVSFAADQASVLLPVTPISDGIDEGSETLRLTLREGVGYRIGSERTSVLTFADPLTTAPRLRTHLPLEEGLTDVASGAEAIVAGDPELLPGGGLDLDGKGDQLELPADTLSELGPTGLGEAATIGLRIRPEQFGGYQTVFDTEGRELSLWLHTPTEGWYGVGGVHGKVVFDEPFTLGEWQHVAMVVRDGQVGIYRNGVLVATEAAAPIKSAALVVGGNPSGGGSNFDGEIEDVRVYNYALSPAELPGSINKIA